MIFTLITGPTREIAHQILQQALKKGVDGVEIRVDTFKNIDLAEIQSLRNEATTVKVLLTLRPIGQGGSYGGTEPERLQLIEQLCAFYPDFLDLEYDIPRDFRLKLLQNYPNIKFLCSYHNFEETPEDLPALLQSIQAPGVHAYKIATMARSSLDGLRMVKFVRDHALLQPLIGISMGEYGLITRVLGPAGGNLLNYAFIDPRDQTAPGQISFDELKHLYHYQTLNDRTKICALIGDPIDKSLGHIVHNAVFERLKINAIYVKIKIQPSELGPFLTLVRKLPFIGLSITMPLKEAIIPFLDEISPSVKMIGAVNTIEIRGGKLIGHNTDGSGAMNAIEEKLPIAGKKIVVIGAGGAAKGLIYEAVKRRAHVCVLNRTASKAEELATHLHCQGGGLELMPHIFTQGYDIIVNCTPHTESINPQWIIPGCLAMDMVYVPKKTPFLLQALQKNCRVVYGYEMFVNQAVEQQIIWFNKNQEYAQIKEVIEAKVVDNLK